MATLTEALRALRRQKRDLEALDPVPTKLVRTVRRELARLREERERRQLEEQLAAATDPAEIATLTAAIAALENENVIDFRDAWRAIRDMEATPALFDAEDFNDDLIFLMQRFDQLPENASDPIHVADGRWPHKNQLRLLLRRVARSTAPEIDEGSKEVAFGFLRRKEFFDEDLAEDPELVAANAAVVALESGALSAEQLRAALKDLVIED